MLFSRFFDYEARHGGGGVLGTLVDPFPFYRDEGEEAAGMTTAAVSTATKTETETAPRLGSSRFSLNDKQQLPQRAQTGDHCSRQKSVAVDTRSDLHPTTTVLVSREAFLNIFSATQALLAYFTLTLWNYLDIMRLHSATTLSMSTTRMTVASGEVASQAEDVVSPAHNGLAPAYLALTIAGLFFTILATVVISIVNVCCYSKETPAHYRRLMTAAKARATAAAKTDPRQLRETHRWFELTGGTGPIPVKGSEGWEWEEDSPRVGLLRRYSRHIALPRFAFPTDFTSSFDDDYCEVYQAAERQRRRKTEKKERTLRATTATAAAMPAPTTQPSAPLSFAPSAASGYSNISWSSPNPPQPPGETTAPPLPPTTGAAGLYPARKSLTISIPIPQWHLRRAPEKRRQTKRKKPRAWAALFAGGDEEEEGRVHDMTPRNHDNARESTLMREDASLPLPSMAERKQAAAAAGSPAVSADTTTVLLPVSRHQAEQQFLLYVAFALTVTLTVLDIVILARTVRDGRGNSGGVAEAVLELTVLQVMTPIVGAALSLYTFRWLAVLVGTSAVTVLQNALAFRLETG